MYNYQNYFTPQMQMPINNIPVYQPQIQPKGLSGRYVGDFSEVCANDVSMDGSYSWFIKSDMSEIEARFWNSNGQIQKISFKPISNASNVNTPMPTENADMGQIMATMNEIKEMLNAMTGDGKDE